MSTKQTSPSPVESVVHKCEGCFNRPGQLVCQDTMPASEHYGITEPWVFRYYLCRYCRAVSARRGVPRLVLEFTADEQLLIS